MGLRLAHSCFACALLVAILGFSGPSSGARAQDAAQGRGPARGPLALHWVRLPGTEACIAGDALARVVETKLRRDVFPAPRDASLLIEGHVAKTAEGFAAELRMSDAQGNQLGSRDLSSSDKSCRELSETLGVVLAVMIDPDAARRTPSALSLAPEPKAKEEPARPRERDNRMLAFARVLLGLTQKPLIGFGAAYERALGRAGGLRLEAAMFLENVDDSPKDAARTLLHVAYAGAAYCPLWLEFERARLSGCAGLEFGAVSARDDNFPTNKADQNGFWASASASLRLAIALYGPLELHLGGSFLGMFGSRFGIPPKEDPPKIFPKHSAPLGGGLDFGLGARF